MLPSLLPFGKALNRFSLIVFVALSYLILQESQPIFQKICSFVIINENQGLILWHFYNSEMQIFFEKPETHPKQFLNQADLSLIEAKINLLFSCFYHILNIRDRLYFFDSLGKEFLYEIRLF